MYSRLNDIEFLELLVATGKSLKTMRVLLGCGDKFLLNKLQKLGLMDPSLTVEDCRTPQTKIKTMKEVFPYEQYVERYIKNKEKLYNIALEYGFNYNTLKYVVGKYKNRYNEEQTGPPLQTVPQMFGRS